MGIIRIRSLRSVWFWARVCSI